ncbi:phospholipase C/P1 nuclease [Rickenella mellea]|uniref:Phospholipase C/P1 nuclease n=1 Tax=Rickenella mellea TaxID=50990 RepID=A0A4Y7QA47_9AGAM|nr:phospholipase C/P1 nuclease [Rickenella mellea]
MMWTLNKGHLVSLAALCAALPTTLAWGAAGHEIVATIAQIHLDPSVAAALCEVLPESAKCHLAPVAAWADNIRMRMRWSAPLHFANPTEDHPSQHCEFGGKGWAGKPGMHILGAVQNTSMWIRNGLEGEEEALKFLVHFVGDLHQPLHLTGRDRGGNSDKVRFDRRLTNLHTVWDSKLIAKSLRTISRNYTHPLPSQKIESALRGTIYDPYIRQIMHEGILGRFKSEIPAWLACPSELSSPPHRAYPLQIQTLRESFPSTTSLQPSPPTDDSLICPFSWAEPLHALNCDIIWPAELDEPSYAGRQPHEYIELDTPQYSGVIKEQFIIERLLAMGGIRLAAILNYLYGNEDGNGLRVNMDFDGFH